MENADVSKRGKMCETISNIILVASDVAFICCMSYLVGQLIDTGLWWILARAKKIQGRRIGEVSVCIDSWSLSPFWKPASSLPSFMKACSHFQ